MTELAVVEAPVSTGSVELDEKITWARNLAHASLLPRAYQKQPGNLLFAAEYADSLGISRINAITSIHVIDGRPSASSDLIASLIRRAGHKLRVIGDDTYAEAQLIRSDDPDFVYKSRWDMAKAEKAGLATKGVWRNYPGAMLRSRAISEVARMGASEALLGVIYTPEELGAEIDPSTGEVVHQITRVEATATAGADRIRGFLGVDGSDGDRQDGEEPEAPDAAPEATTPAEKPAAPVEEPKPQRRPAKVTQAQLGKINAALTERGMTDRIEALTYVSEVVGRLIQTRNDLTKVEASQVIDRLEAMPLPSNEPDADGIVDAEVVPDKELDPDLLWQQITSLAADLGIEQVSTDFSKSMGGLIPIDATAGELAAYLAQLDARAAEAVRA